MLERDEHDDVPGRNSDKQGWGALVERQHALGQPQQTTTSRWAPTCTGAHMWSQPHLRAHTEIMRVHTRTSFFRVCRVMARTPAPAPALAFMTRVLMTSTGDPIMVPTSPHTVAARSHRVHGDTGCMGVQASILPHGLPVDASNTQPAPGGIIAPVNQHQLPHLKVRARAGRQQCPGTARSAW